MKRMFRTERGSEYFLNPDRTWTRLKYDGERFDGYVYIGSIDTSLNPAFPDNGHHYPDVTHRQFISGDVPGLEPSFRLGHTPLGFLPLEDHNFRPGDIQMRGGRLARAKGLSLEVRIHVGHPIVEIYEGELAVEHAWLSAAD